MIWNDSDLGYLIGGSFTDESAFFSSSAGYLRRFFYVVFIWLLASNALSSFLSWLLHGSWSTLLG
jgi:uncharacterized membrane protein AbrB (regulator of aidB expression)